MDNESYINRDEVLIVAGIELKFVCFGCQAKGEVVKFTTRRRLDDHLKTHGKIQTTTRKG
jgi:hypothetical protein